MYSRSGEERAGVGYGPKKRRQRTSTSVAFIYKRQEQFSIPVTYHALHGYMNLISEQQRPCNGDRVQSAREPGKYLLADLKHQVPLSLVEH